MRFTTVAAASVAALAIGVAASAKTQDQAFGTLATPAGITLQVLGNGQGYGLGKEAAAVQVRDQVAFTDLKGLTLYTYDKDPIGKATCDAECAQLWQPMLADGRAKPFGAWSVIARPDGAKQWAYQGKALYRFVKDVDPGSVWGNSPARFGTRRKNGAGEFVGGGIRGSGVKNAAPDLPAPDGWHIALAYPVSGVAVPTGIAIKEVPDALGLVLVDYRNRTLYAFDGDPAKDTKVCGSPCAWQPAAAAQLAEPVGDFSVVVRPDGIKQWAYKGKGLYAYAGDLTAGDANGIGADKHWQPATIIAYFMPASVSVQRTASQGEILATRDGMTLYKRDGFIHQSGGGHSLRRGTPPRPAVGRDIGTDARCSRDCDKWHPFLAPAGAQSQGFWTVADRADGAKQWTYQGSALWTYDGDKKPGDMNGNDDFEFAFAGGPSRAENAPFTAFDFGTSMDGAPQLNWAIVAP
jgi:predicted lipoprotein with Yx(FWY)xxD motif